MEEADRFRKEQIEAIVNKYGVPNVGDDYDPNKNRNLEHPTNYIETLIHVIKGSLGTGIMAMPLVFKLCGYVNGFIFSVIVVIVASYGIHIYFDSQYKICKKLKTGYMPYPLIMKSAFLTGPYIFTKCANPMAITINIFMVSYQIGVCTSYIIFMSENIKDVYELNNPDSKIALELYMLMLLVPIFIISSVPNMKLMAKFSLLSNLICFIACAIMTKIMLHGEMPPVSKLNKTGEFLDTAVSCGIILFAISAMAVLVQVEKYMKNPDHMVRWWGTLNVAMTIILLWYTFIGFLGYWKYGPNVKDAITLNLNADNRAYCQTVQILLCIAIYITYGLNAMVPVHILWDDYLSERLAESKYKNWGVFIIRVFVVLLTMICAVSVPFFGDVLSLLGSFGMSAMELIFPSFIHICVHWPDNLGFMKWILILDLLLATVGVFGMISGTYGTILSIQKHLAELRG
ncbi:hypothetical protein FQA39_LY07731 [Lamprigera yunnana]|nr:hypothetical protein FQA39_LY07731 [Lamprigera yunnana]